LAVREVLRATPRPPLDVLDAGLSFIDRDRLQSAAPAFAAGEIDRAELMG
jgi:hypothetical protein